MRVYTDGSCRFKMGGWAWWNEDTEQYDTGVEFPSTNQRMELAAALDAVDTYLGSEDLVIVSDSRYLVDCFQHQWFKVWQNNGWKNNKGAPLKNLDIWQPLIILVEKHGTVKFEWVPGHKGIKGNEMADAYATGAVLEYNLVGGGVETMPLFSANKLRKRTDGQGKDER